MENIELEHRQFEHDRNISQGQLSIERFGNIKDLFLDNNTAFDCQVEKYNKALAAMWDICNLFYPGERLGYTGPMLASSEQLVKLGLVSQTTTEKIIKRSERKREHGQKGDVVNSSILIEKNKGGFIITETYVSEEESHGLDEDEIRIDSIIEEKTYLTREGDKINISMEEKKGKPHLHALGKIWLLENFEEESFKPLEISPKHINTALALLAQCAHIKVE